LIGLPLPLINYEFPVDERDEGLVSRNIVSGQEDGAAGEAGFENENGPP